MTPATVGFHPAAAQEAESAYDWYAARDLSAAHAFREELQHAVDAVAQNPLCAVMKSKSSLSLTAGDGPGTGVLASEQPSNFRLQPVAAHFARCGG